MIHLMIGKKNEFLIPFYQNFDFIKVKTDSSAYVIKAINSIILKYEINTLYEMAQRLFLFFFVNRSKESMIIKNTHFIFLRKT